MVNYIQMSNIDIHLLELAYPNLFHSIKNLYDFDRRVESYIENKYGKNTIENIIKFNEYNNEKVNNGKVNKGNISEFSKVAQKHNEYFQKFLFESIKVKDILGYINTDQIIKQIQNHIRPPTTPIDTSFMNDYI